MDPALANLSIGPSPPLSGRGVPQPVQAVRPNWAPKFMGAKNLLSVLSIYNNFRFILISKLITETINVACYFLRKKAH